MNKVVKVLHFDDQADFKNIFLNERFKNGFLFRGQANAGHSLTPAVARNQHLDIEPKHVTLQEDDDEHLRLRCYEFRLLRNFIKGCDISGSTIPGDGPELRESFKLAARTGSIPFAMMFPGKSVADELEQPDSDWPRKSDYPLIIMAQHHGLPTRLLDWTRSVYAAMYFAAVGGMNRMVQNMKPEDKRVYEDKSTTEADNRISLSAIDARAVNALGVSRSPCCLLETPASLSVNITAQQGCFSASLVEMASKKAYALDESESLSEHIVQCTLPIWHSTDIYRYCADAGYTGARLFPGPDGAAKHANELQLLLRLSQIPL